MYLAKYYIEREKWIPAINRYKNVLSKFETTIYVEEALHRLVEIHYKIGLIDESKKYAALLGYNYQSSEWYRQSYKVFNKDYEKIRKKRKKKKNKLSTLEKIKSLLKNEK
jgi:outer membrane protein assembly factor BamD